MQKWIRQAEPKADDFVFPSRNQTKLFDSANFATQSEIWVTKDIRVSAFDVGEWARLSSFQQRFSRVQAVPEPGSLALVGVGLARRRSA